MHYCKAGQLLIVKPKLEIGVSKFCRHFNGVPYTLAITAADKEHIRIAKNTIVMALEASLAPLF